MDRSNLLAGLGNLPEGIFSTSSDAGCCESREMVVPYIVFNSESDVEHGACQTLHSSFQLQLVALYLFKDQINIFAVCCVRNL